MLYLVHLERKVLEVPTGLWDWVDVLENFEGVLKGSSKLDCSR